MTAARIPARKLVRVAIAVAMVAVLASACNRGDKDEPSPAEKAVEQATAGTKDMPETLGGTPASRFMQLWTWENGELLFSSNRGGHADIYLTRGADTTWTNLTSDEAGDNWPVWSPDGSRIAFQRIVGEDAKLDIFVMDDDGANVVQLTDDPEDDFLPAWTPDGKQITFMSWRQEPADSVPVKVGSRMRLPKPASHIYIMDADGSNERRLVADPPGTSTALSWASDAQTFVFARKEGKQGADIYIAAPDGIVVRRLTNDAAANGAPDFSPDGKHIVFHADYGDHSEIVVIDRWGLGRTVVVAEGKNWYPRFSPDGRWIVYTAANPAGPKNNLDVMAIAVDGGQSVVLAGGPDREAEGSWRPFH